MDYIKKEITQLQKQYVLANKTETVHKSSVNDITQYKAISNAEERQRKAKDILEELEQGLLQLDDEKVNNLQIRKDEKYINIMSKLANMLIDANADVILEELKDYVIEKEMKANKPKIEQEKFLEDYLSGEYGKMLE
jgi:hypothetical protein